MKRWPARCHLEALLVRFRRRISGAHVPMRRNCRSNYTAFCETKHFQTRYHTTTHETDPALNAVRKRHRQNDANRPTAEPCDTGFVCSSLRYAPAELMRETSRVGVICVCGIYGWPSLYSYKDGLTERMHHLCNEYKDGSS